MDQRGRTAPEPWPGGADQSSAVRSLRRTLYAWLLPVLAVTTLVTGFLGTAPYDAVVLPAASVAMLLLELALLLGRLPTRYLERTVYALFVAVYLGKVWTSLPTGDLTQLYVWAPLLPVLGLVLFEPRPALVVSAGVIAATAAMVGGRAAGGAAMPPHVVEFFLASSVLLGMAYALSRLRVRVASLQGQVVGLRELAHEDALTGLPNRRQLEASLQAWLVLVSRNAQPLSVILFDLDDFKRVNDGHGHDVGDAVLRAVARRGEEVLRRPDVLGRWGGEEFLVIAPGTDLRGAMTLAERLRRALEAEPFAAAGGVTASFGVTSVRPGDGAETLLKRADDAHYVAKQAGKNRVEALVREYVQHVRMPPLAQPFRVRPVDADELQRGTLAWLKRFEVASADTLYRWVEAVQPGRLARHLHPRLDGAGQQIVSDWYFWMFLHDDRCDASADGRDPGRLVTLHGALVEVLEGADPEGAAVAGVLAPLLADLRDRLGARASASQMARFRGALADYFEATRWEAANRARGSTPEPASYQRMRLRTSGVAVDTVLAQVLDRVPQSDHPLAAELQAAADLAVCWANDLYSLNKEVQERDVHNLVLSLQAGEGLGLEAALERAAAMHDAQVARFLRARREIARVEGAERQRLERLAEALEARIAGNHAWSQGSSRYTAAVTVRVPERDGSGAVLAAAASD